MIDLHHGDCLDVLAGMEDGSVSSCVCDPPYELGFMGKGWDSTGIAYNVGMWREVLRVLKPGGHLIAFGGSRTYHRLAVAVEDAGFEVRDQGIWLYGCLSEDTEILIDGQWEQYHKAIAGSTALCYDVASGEFEWMSVKELLVYDYDDTAYRIRSDRTDQIVSRNHRCIVERGGREVFAKAETLERREAIPFLEGVPEVRGAVPVPHEGASQPPEVLRAGLLDYNSRTHEATEREGWQVGCVRSMRQGKMDVEQQDQEGGKPDLLLQMQWNTAGQGVGEAGPQGAHGMECGSGRIGKIENDRGQQPCLERRRDVLQEERQLQADQIRAMPAMAVGNVPQGRVCHGAPAYRCGRTGATAQEVRGCAPHQPRSAGQQARKPTTIRKQQGPQTARGQRATRSTLAEVTPMHYTGKVWCVRVPTGAFVARRNGKVFVTGNSGFPKSLDVSKAIDKAAGAEREVVGKNPTYRRDQDNPPSWTLQRNPCITAPATDDARKWSGWGTALKPAHEPFVIARKPFKGTVAANVLKHGTGAINVDGCRVGQNHLTGQLPDDMVNAEGGAQWEEHRNRVFLSAAIAALETKLTELDTCRNSATPDAVQPMGAREETTHADTNRLDTGCSDGTRAESTSTSLNIAAFGRMPTAQSRKDIASIIATATSKTIDWKTWSACPLVSTYSTTRESITVALKTLRLEESRRSNTENARANGRFPSNLIHDGSHAAIKLLGPESRYFYCAKASRAEREAGCEGLPARTGADACDRDEGTAGLNSPRAGAGRSTSKIRNHHPCVKPLSLMRYLVRLVTPPGGTVLDHFAGSGTCGVAAVMEGFGYVGIELDAEYYRIAKARIEAARHKPGLCFERTKRRKDRRLI